MKRSLLITILAGYIVLVALMGPAMFYAGLQAGSTTLTITTTETVWATVTLEVEAQRTNTTHIPDPWWETYRRVQQSTAILNGEFSLAYDKWTSGVLSDQEFKAELERLQEEVQALIGELEVKGVAEEWRFAYTTFRYALEYQALAYQSLATYLDEGDPQYLERTSEYLQKAADNIRLSSEAVPQP